MAKKSIRDKKKPKNNLLKKAFRGKSYENEGTATPSVGVTPEKLPPS